MNDTNTHTVRSRQPLHCVPTAALIASWAGPIIWFFFQIAVLDISVARAVASPLIILTIPAAFALTIARMQAGKHPGPGTPKGHTELTRE